MVWGDSSGGTVDVMLAGGLVVQLPAAPGSLLKQDTENQSSPD